MSQDAVHDFLKMAGRYPLLDRGEQMELIRRAQAGDRRAMEKMVQHGLRLAVSNAKRYFKFPGVEPIDLLQEAAIALRDAVVAFDLSKGFAFTTYATWKMKGRLSRYIVNSNRIIRVPAHVQEAVNLIRKTHAQLRLKLGREATTSEVAKQIGRDTEWIKEKLEAVRAVDSIDRQINRSGHKQEGEACTIADLLIVPDYDKDKIFQSLEHDEILVMLESALSPRNASMVADRFGLHSGDPQSLDIIAKTFNLSRERVRQIVDKSLIKLKRHATKVGVVRPVAPKQPPTKSEEEMANESLNKLLRTIAEAKKQAIASGSYEMPNRNRLTTLAGVNSGYFYQETRSTQIAVEALTKAEAELVALKPKQVMHDYGQRLIHLITQAEKDAPAMGFVFATFEQFCQQAHLPTGYWRDNIDTYNQAMTVYRLADARLEALKVKHTEDVKAIESLNASFNEIAPVEVKLKPDLMGMVSEAEAEAKRLQAEKQRLQDEQKQLQAQLEQELRRLKEENALLKQNAAQPVIATQPTDRIIIEALLEEAKKYEDSITTLTQQKAEIIQQIDQEQLRLDVVKAMVRDRAGVLPEAALNGHRARVLEYAGA